jgi:hypothetical protein
MKHRETGRKKILKEPWRARRALDALHAARLDCRLAASV